MSKYILVDAIGHHGNKKSIVFESVTDIRRVAIRMLDGKGWDDKHQVDLRSLSSMIGYIFDDFPRVAWTRTTSYAKCIGYRSSRRCF